MWHVSCGRRKIFRGPLLNSVSKNLKSAVLYCTKRHGPRLTANINSGWRCATCQSVLFKARQILMYIDKGKLKGLTSRGAVLPEKLAGTQLIKNHPAFYELESSL